MNPDQLAAWFAAHKVAVLGGGAAAVAALGLRARKKRAAAAPGTTAGATIPGTIPAAAVVGGSSPAVYDSTAFDMYDSLNQRISDLTARQQTTTGGTPAAASGPIASSLFAPTDSTQFARYGTQIVQVQADGSLYGLSLAEWQALGAPANYVQLGADRTQTPATVYTRAANIASKIKAGSTPVAAAGA